VASWRHWPDVWYPLYVSLVALPFALAHAKRMRDDD
jgi:hypothetical protein